MSKAPSTASTPAADTSATTSSSDLPTHSLPQYWGKEWVGKSEDDVVADVSAAGVEAVLGAFDIEAVAGGPPCPQPYGAPLRGRHPAALHRGRRAGGPFQGT